MRNENGRFEFFHRDVQAHYEDLRDQRLNGANGLHEGQSGLGLALFIRRGMLVWLRSRSLLSASSLALRTGKNDSIEISRDLKSEIVMVLANMALAHRHLGGVINE